MLVISTETIYVFVKYVRVSFKIRPKLILGQSLRYLHKIYGRYVIAIYKSKNIGIFIVLAFYDVLQ
jgi:hypothetical protein